MYTCTFSALLVRLRVHVHIRGVCLFGFSLFVTHGDQRQPLDGAEESKSGV